MYIDTSMYLCIYAPCIILYMSWDILLRMILEIHMKISYFFFWHFGILHFADWKSNQSNLMANIYCTNPEKSITYYNIK